MFNVKVIVMYQQIHRDLSPDSSSMEHIRLFDLIVLVLSPVYCFQLFFQP